MGITRSIELLGSSQTHLGVLATIIILFIFASKNSNLIFCLLHEVRDKISEQIKKLQKNTGLKPLTESNAYKLLTHTLKAEDNTLSDDQKVEGKKLMNRITLERQNFQYTYLPVGNYEDVLDKILNAREHMLAPLYTVLFCLMVFIFDELLHSSHIGFSDFLLSSLAIFILLSFILWVLMWIVFVVNVGYNIAHIEDEKAEKNENEEKKDDWKGFTVKKKMAWYDKFIQDLNSHSIYLTYVLRILLLLVVLVLVFYLCHLIPELPKWVMLFSGVVFPTLVVGLLRMSVRRKKGGYTYLFMCGHFLAIIIMSVLYAIVILSLADFWDCREQILFSFDDCRWFKIFIFLFVLLNGILCPFVVPYYAYNRLYRDSKKKVKASVEKYKEVSETLTHDLDDFCKDIPPAKL